jgi:hypothetical protein
VKHRKGTRRVRMKKPDKRKIRNAIPTTNKDGTKFRSKLENFTYTKLLEAGIKDFKYEEERFNLIDSFEYPEEQYETYTRTRDGVKVKEFGKVSPTIRNMSYLPDFTCIDHKTRTGWLIEVKGFDNDAFPIRWKLFKHYLVSNNYNISLYKPNTQGNVLKCIEMIKEKYYGRD